MFFGRIFYLCLIMTVLSPIVPANSTLSHQILPAAYPRLPAQPPILPPAYRNYFSLDGDTAGLIRSIAGPGILPESFFNYGPLRTTTPPSWTRPTTPKDSLIGFMEKTIDNILNNDFPSQQQEHLDKNSIEADSLLFSMDKNEQSVSNTEEEIDGSGSEPNVTTKIHSSIAGIPKVYPNISKVPLDFRVPSTIPTASKFNDVDSIIPNFKVLKPEIPQGGFGPLKKHDSNIRRHPGTGGGYSPKTVEEFQYGSKPTYKQGLMSSVLDFLGIHRNTQNDNLPAELDRTITEWLLQHSPTYTTRAERRAKVESSYNRFQKFIAQNMMPLCTPQPESVENFNVAAFMGQWYQVMHSPLMSSSSCSMMSYELLSETNNGIGSMFQTMEYSVPRLDERFRDGASGMLSSGYAMVSRPGQLIYRKSNSPEDAIVHVISVGPMINGKYEYAVLSINCNYPLYVIARDPIVFQRKSERTVNAILQAKGLINEVSRFLNIVKPVDFSQCLLPPTFFDGK